MNQKTQNQKDSDLNAEDHNIPRYRIQEKLSRNEINVLLERIEGEDETPVAIEAIRKLHEASSDRNPEYIERAKAKLYDELSCAIQAVSHGDWLTLEVRVEAIKDITKQIRELI